MLFRKNPTGTLHNVKIRESSFARYHRARDLRCDKKKYIKNDKTDRSNAICYAKYLIESPDGQLFSRRVFITWMFIFYT